MNVTQLHQPTERRNVLLVALDEWLPAGTPAAEVLVIAPAVNSALRHWVSDDDRALRRAAERAVALVGSLERSGAHAEGRVGDADPLLAIEDALRTFAADEIVIAADPGRWARQTDRLARRAQERFALPVSCAVGGLPIAA